MNRCILDWSADEVQAWLKTKKYEDVSSSFEAQEIDGKALLLLKEDDLKSILTDRPLGIIKKLFHDIQELKHDNKQALREEGYDPNTLFHVPTEASSRTGLVYATGGDHHAEYSKRHSSETELPPPSKKKRYSFMTNAFESILQETWFVDKTLLIGNIIDIMLPASVAEKLPQRDPVLMTAPRRFGKTTNLYMLLSFFGGLVDRTIFENLNIGSKSTAMQWWGKFNVVYVSFSNFAGSIKCETDGKQACRSILHAAFQNFAYLEEYQSESNLSAFKQWLHKENYLKKNDTEVGDGLKFLVQCICEYDNKVPILIFVDEFDAICSSAIWNIKDVLELENLIKFYCDVLGNAIKSEPKCLAIMTGVTAVTSKGLSASLNNINYRRFLEHSEFATFFGITVNEFNHILSSEKVSLEVVNLKNEALRWYNGYQAFGCKILSTYSVKRFMENKEIRPYWRESSSVDAFDKGILGAKLTRDTLKSLLDKDHEPVEIYHANMLKLSDFQLFGNEAYKLVKIDAVMNYLVQQGYLTIIGSRTSELVQVLIPNLELELEFENLLTEYYIQVLRFNPREMRACRDLFLNMNMKDINSCHKNLKKIKKKLNELLGHLDKMNESWLESFIWQLFFQQADIKQQEKVEGTSKKKNDRRKWKVLDLCVIAADRCFLFKETTCKPQAETACRKIIDKKYYKIVQKTKLPYLLIGINVKKEENIQIISMSYIYNSISLVNIKEV